MTDAEPLYQKVAKKVAHEASTTIGSNDVSQDKQDKEIESISDVCEQSCMLYIFH